MENNVNMPSTEPSSEGSVTSVDAQAALDALAADRAQLAERLVTPAWYHPALGCLVAALILSAYLGTGLGTVLFVAYCAGLAALVSAYRRLTGLWSNGWQSRAGRPYAVGLFLLLVGAVGVAFAARSGSLPSWTVIVAMVLCAASFIVVGPRYDTVVRASMRDAR